MPGLLTANLLDLSTAAALFALLIGSLEGGYRLGQRAAGETDAPHSAGQIGAIQGAVLGLLGLLLAFSFSAASARFLDRQDIIAQEANAIGTAYLRADLIDEPHRTTLRNALAEYTRRRLEIPSRFQGQPTAEDLQHAERLHRVMWRAASDGVAAKPSAMLGVLPPVNEVIDLHTLRLSAAKKRLPTLVIGLLIMASAVALGDIGYGVGFAGRRRRSLLTLSLAALIAACLWITIDLDNARSGLLRLSDWPLHALTFDEPAPPAPPDDARDGHP